MYKVLTPSPQKKKSEARTSSGGVCGFQTSLSRAPHQKPYTVQGCVHIETTSTVQLSITEGEKTLPLAIQV